MVSPGRVTSKGEVFVLPEDLNLLALVDRTLVDCVRSRKVDDLVVRKYTSPSSTSPLTPLFSTTLYNHHLQDHLTEEDSIIHLLVHVRTVFLQWKFVVHILFKESNHYHQFDHNHKNYQAY